VLMGLVHPLGFRAREVEAIAQILDGYEPLPLPTQVPRPGKHTHVVDLSLSEGASVLDGACVQGRRLRYFDLRALIEHLKSLDQATSAEADNGLTRQMASLIERGGISRSRERANRFGRISVAGGIDNVLTALADPDTAQSSAALESWVLRDESMEGMGFVLSAAQVLPHGRLVAVSWEPSEKAWQLQAIRWTREEDGQYLVGTQCLSRHPKRVEIQVEEGESGAKQEKTWALFLPMNHPGQGVSNLLMPPTHYRMGAPMTLLDGEVIYRLRLGEVQESHEGWLRVGMEVVGREQFAAAA